MSTNLVFYTAEDKSSDSRNTVFKLCILLHEYKDLFIDMDVRNNRSELVIANRHQER